MGYVGIYKHTCRSVYKDANGDPITLQRKAQLNTGARKPKDRF